MKTSRGSRPRTSLGAGGCIRLCVCGKVATSCVVLIGIILTVLYVSQLLYPELRMISNYQCKNPLQSWNGKLMNYQVWRSGFEGRPLGHNVHFRSNSSHDRLRRRLLEKNETAPHSQATRIILWGAHHKTGTFLAQKVFSVICSRMRWCCIFHPTRDSIDAIHEVFNSEPVSVIGHNQWIWYPEEIAGHKAYRFVHFYRDPVRKIVSGYRYHKEGVEPWTLVSKPYHQLCDSQIYRRSPEASQQQQHEWNSSSKLQTVGRFDVVEHCKAVHLCVTCCRREHERDDLIHSRRFASLSNHKQDGLPVIKREYALRAASEYRFLCKHLGRVHALRDELSALPLEDGLLTEAALDFYESLRMAHILNHTRHDPDTLNLNLDDLTENVASFRSTIWQLLKFLDLDLTNSELLSLAREIDFYNIKTAGLYKWSMSLPSLNHIDFTGAASASWAALLAKNADFQRMYRPVFDLMPKKT